MVYQLPYRRFPEEVATVASADYDLLRPYLQTDTIRWSYGGMKGREADWQRRLEGTSVTDFVRNIRSVGFVGVLVDRAGYSDYGIQLEQEINAVTGVGGSQSSDGRWVFFDLSRLADPSESAEVRSRLADELLYSPRIDVEDCADAEGAGVGEFNWCGTRGSIRVTDPAPDGRPNVLTAEIEAPGGEGTLYVDVDGLTTEFTIGPSLTTVSFAVPSAEVVTIQLSTDVPRFAAAGDARDLRFRLIFPQVTAQAD